MSPPPPHEIPTDVLYEILLQYGVKNLSFLWLSCRPVSRNFKDAVERVFVTKHLRKTWLHVDTGELETDVELQFYGLDPTDSARAVFESYKHQDYLERTLRSGSSLEFPNVIIQILHDANDTMLPDFRHHLDPNKFEVSFDWKEMYSHFFREQKEAQTRFDERYRSIAERHMSTASEAERVVMMELFHGFRLMASALDRVRIVRTVRSERIRRNTLENEGRVVSGNDHEGFDKLNSKKRLVLERPYSDESAEEEDSKDEEASSEDDKDDFESGEGSEEDEDEDNEVLEEDSDNFDSED